MRHGFHFLAIWWLMLVPFSLTHHLRQFEMIWRKISEEVFCFILFIHLHPLGLFQVNVSLSTVSSQNCHSILIFFGLAEPVSIPLNVPPPHRGLSKNSFKWVLEKEDAQMNRCMKWVQNLASLPADKVMFLVAG